MIDILFANKRGFIIVQGKNVISLTLLKTLAVKYFLNLPLRFQDKNKNTYLAQNVCPHTLLYIYNVRVSETDIKSRITVEEVSVSLGGVDQSYRRTI